MEVIAEESFIYLYPLVLMDITRKHLTAGGVGIGPYMPMNAVNHMRACPPLDFTAVARPNFDTLYSSEWLDLTYGPVVLSVPDSGGRYYVLPTLDLWTDVIASPGWRTIGITVGESFDFSSPDTPTACERARVPAYEKMAERGKRTSASLSTDGACCSA